MEFYENFCLYFKKYAQKLLQLLELTVEKSTMHTKLVDIAVYKKKYLKKLEFHEGKKPFNCELCGNCFTSKQKLNQNVTSIHERKMPFNFEICGNSFVSKQTMKFHVSSIHEGEKQYK